MITKQATANHEEWKTVPGFGSYLVSNAGKVKSCDRDELIESKRCEPYVRSRAGRELKQAVDRYGYMKVVLLKNGKPHYLTVHRLVAMAFVPNPRNLNTVDHIDGNRENNNASNLRWVTPTENLFFSHDACNQRINATPVVAIDPQGNVYQFRSQKYAAKITGVGQWAISRALHGGHPDTKGWSFKYDHKN